MRTELYDLHNICEIDLASGYPGPLLRRVPRSVSQHLLNGTLSTGDCSLSEIRFRSLSGRRCAVVLTSISGGDLFIYRGDLLHAHVRLPAGQVVRHIIDWEKDPLASLQSTAFAGGRFHPSVWRVVLDGATLFHGIDLIAGRIAPPLPDQVPRRRWLAYGSSITHGYSPVTRQQCYVAIAARRLGVDALNLGQSGSCFCEPEMVDHLAGRDDWDIATCELGINMRYTVPVDDFAARACHLVETMTRRHPGKPLVLITPFLTGDDLHVTPSSLAAMTTGYAKVLLGLANAQRHVHVIHGHDLLPHVSGLTCDLVHPSSEGHALIAERLAERLAPLLPMPA